MQDLHLQFYCCYSRLSPHFQDLCYIMYLLSMTVLLLITTVTSVISDMYLIYLIHLSEYMASSSEHSHYCSIQRHDYRVNMTTLVFLHGGSGQVPIQMPVLDACIQFNTACHCSTSMFVHSLCTQTVEACCLPMCRFRHMLGPFWMAPHLRLLSTV